MPVNKIDGLPSVTEIQKEIKREEKQDQNLAKKKNLRPILLILAIVALILGTISVLNGNPVGKSTGSISGKVVNESGAPVSAEIYVVSTNLSTTADVEGNFSLTKIPAGNNDVLIAFQGQGVELQVVIQKDQNLPLGSIQVRSTQIPVK